jgi:demethylmenaquinone methyltransferase/2-methoxy-6-polyprenyl-1,4-benzoquinol methylase
MLSQFTPWNLKERLDPVSETDDYIRSLIDSNPFHEPIVEAAIAQLRLPAGSRGLDAGCGIGLQVPLLLEAVVPGGHVTGLDLSPQFLTRARDLTHRIGIAERTSFKEGSVKKLPFTSDAFDWAWSANCVGYAPFDPLPPLKEMARVVKPGGTVAILVWSSQQLLPGYPLLEARLNATSSGIAPFTAGMGPEQHCMRAPGFMRRAGLRDVRGRTFISEAQAPLSEEMRRAITLLIDMRWPGAESEISNDDREQFQRLCRPQSPDFILNLPDYYAFFTETLFYGRVEK